MIKINLLKNDLSMHGPRERPVFVVESATDVIRLEAKKSSRRVVIFMVLFTLLIAGGVLGYINRYPLVAFIEQYTGPLNILSPQVVPLTQEQIDQMRREKRRMDYVRNTLLMHERDHRFLLFLDTSNTNNPNVWLSSVDLDGNDFTLDMFGKTENDLKAYSNQVTQLDLVKSRDAKDIRSSSAVPGYAYRRQMLGVLISPQIDETDSSSVSVAFPDVKKTNGIIRELAVRNLSKASLEERPGQTKGVIFDKYSSTLKIESPASDFLKFLKMLQQQQLNFEMTKYTINYTVQRSGRPKPDVAALEYNVIIPVIHTSAKTDTGGTAKDTSKAR